MKRGHSNVRASETAAWDDKDTPPELGIAKIPLRGGATFDTVRELPPLALHRHDWEEIGRRMGWLTLTKRKK